MSKAHDIIYAMNCIILQPKASRLACSHFANTMINGVKTGIIYSLIDSHDKNYIESLNLGSILRIWGVMEHNTSKFKKISRGDLVLFTANNFIEAYGTIAYSFNCPRLAKFLWGQDNLETWSNIYIIENFRKASGMPVKALNKALGYQENNVIQGFTVIDDKNKINGFLREYNYANNTLTMKDAKKTATSLSLISGLLNNKNGLTLEEIKTETGASKEELEALLKGGIIGKIFKIESGKYYNR